jgi:hypothetical protein
MDRYILVVGDLVDGVSFIGPFDDSTEATEYAEFTLREPWVVAPLDPKPAPVQGTVSSLDGSVAPEALLVVPDPEGGPAEFLVTLWPGGMVEMARRPHPSSTWGPPVVAERRPTR